MILEAKNSTVAYRCPSCGGWVTSVIGVFSLSADLVKLKCSCAGSEMTIEYTNDKKLRFRVPCFVCPNPHTFTVSPQLFLNREVMAFPCDYTGIDVCLTGEKDAVALSCTNSDKELEEILEGAGYEEFSNASQTAKENLEYVDPQVAEIVNFVVKDLDEAGEITCKCPKDEGLYVVESVNDGIVIRCENCDAQKHLPITTPLSAQSFLDCYHIDLE